ncbi:MULTISPECIES: type IX secretion system protein PorD [unclassified Saccharicrinis]|uniref:type IX secretion system protein PorD n=1 Tax=unclassified Saccharicrinis TaxID=2646859 RepID=UPI003D33C71C
MKNHIVLFLLLLLARVSVSQELQCSVSVVSPSVQGTNKQVFETMQTAIIEFMNGQKWTDNVFSPEERIKCSIMINIKEINSVDDFSGTIQVQVRRPIYNSAYSSMILNYLDQDFDFQYVEFEPLIYNPNSFKSNLVGVLAYYANVILALDYDSFAKMGGTKYMEKAEDIVNQAQNSAQKGWRSYESTRNRYWLVENYLNEHHRPLRECMYQYHRLGLDKMSDKPEDGRKEVLSAIERLQKVHRNKPGSFAMQVFFDAKSEELINIFSESFSMEKARAIEVLSEVDPANASNYSKSLSGNQ